MFRRGPVESDSPARRGAAGDEVPALRIVFMGNGAFAVPALQALSVGNHALELVVARPDLPQGKRLETMAGPVKRAAMDLGLPVVQPEDVNAESFVRELRERKPDVLVVADFGQILSRDCLAAARLGGLNIHGSLLPAYRGAAPVAWAILRGEMETGVSIIQMTPHLDAGQVILQSAIPIDRTWTAGDLEQRLAELGAELILEALSQLERGVANPAEQDELRASRARKLRKEDGRIDWSRTSEEIYNQIRGLQPWPIAYSELHRSGKPPLRLQLLKANDPREENALADSTVAPGTIVEVGSTLTVRTGDGWLRIAKLKPSGKGEMDVAAFCRGNPTSAGARFV